MARSVQVCDPNSRTDDAWGSDLKLCTFDARYRPVAVEIGQLRQVENLPDDVFGSQRQYFLIGESDRFHSTLSSHASSIAFSRSGPDLTGNALFLTSSSLSPNGTTSSARECRI